MSVLDVNLIEESQTRYVTYALSVVSSRALPDVRDGLKPVQRRILYAMAHNLSLTPEKYHRKSAAIVGEVLARYHPHGDAACYEAMVRMAQPFSLRYPLIDGQGNFGSLDGDAAAAYRYTEVRLKPIAMEVVGDVEEETVAERDNFDQTVKEPVVLPSRVPNLLINGASGIAVGMATAIPPHNLNEVVKAILLLLESDDVTDARLASAIKAPDFPTGCLILNTAAELRTIYATGRGPVRMRAGHVLEKDKRGRERIIINSVPYGVEKAGLVEKIADLIIARRIPQLVDVRDESTDVVRVVLELAPGADPEKALTYLFKHTALQHNFNVNLNALIPSRTNELIARPALLSLRDLLGHFIQFRLEVTRRKLGYEKRRLDERIHMLQGLLRVLLKIDEVIRIVRGSKGRADAAERVQQAFLLSEPQAYFIVDLRIYQLSSASEIEVRAELSEKETRSGEIAKILLSEKALKGEIAKDLKRITQTYGDERRSKIVSEFEEAKYERDHYIEHEGVVVVVTKDGWLKRIKSGSDAASTRVREGDEILFTTDADTRDTVLVITNLGNAFSLPVFDISATSGFGEPVQKFFKFQDKEQVACCLRVPREVLQGDKPESTEIFAFSERGYILRLPLTQILSSRRLGRKLMRVGKEDRLKGANFGGKELLLTFSANGYACVFKSDEVPRLTGAGKGVLAQRVPAGDVLVGAATSDGAGRLKLKLEGGTTKEIRVADLEKTGRAKKGVRLIKRGKLLGVE